MMNLPGLRDSLRPSRQAWLASDFGKVLVASVTLPPAEKERWIAELRGDSTYNEDIFRQQISVLIPAADAHLLEDCIFAFIPEVFQTACAVSTPEGMIVKISAAFDMSLRWPLAVCQAFLQCVWDGDARMGMEFKEMVGESVVLFAHLAHNWTKHGEDRDLFIPTLLPSRMALLQSLQPKLPPFAHLAILFVLLHEMGHIALGHLVEKKPITSKPEFLAAQDRSRDEEHEADLYAWDCFCRLPYSPVVLSSVVGCLFHFMDNANKVRGFQASLADSHPQAGSRLLALELSGSPPDEEILAVIEKKMFYFGHPFPLPDLESLKAKLEEQCERF